MTDLLHLLAASMESIDPGSLPTTSADKASIKTILQIVFAILGALAFLMITISGLRYILSSGDPQKAAGARNGVIYALVGLAIALTAEGIVSFVVKSV